MCISGCPSNQQRCSGTCTDVSKDQQNCGSCGNACTGSKTCMAGMCTTPPVNPGAPCAADADCGPGGYCRTAAAGWPNGYCYYAPSMAGCSMSCPAGGACNENAIPQFLVPGVGAAFVCLKSCVTSSDCRQGYVCNVTAPVSVCVPDCYTSTTVCSPGACDQASGQCTLGCMADTDCGPGAACDPGGQLCYCAAGTTCGSHSACSVLDGLCGCADDTYCPSDRHCDTASGECK
jgi:hypothetical protein